MKTAIVMDIEAGSALVMKTGGEFETIPVKKGWRIGDVVSIAEQRRSVKALYAAVACLALVLLGSFGGYQLYFTETAIVSIDINPSIELSLNRFDRVIATEFYNEDGEDVLSGIDLKGMKYDTALEMLLQSAVLRPYLEDNDYLDITVSGNGQLEVQIQSQAQTLTSSFELQISCHRADEETVAEAHAHGMTPGRYLAFLELQALDPDVDIEDYTSHGVGQIRREIEAHHQNRYGGQEEHGGKGNGSGVDDSAPLPSENSGQGGGHGHGSGNGANGTADPGNDQPNSGNGQGGAQGHDRGQGRGDEHGKGHD